MSFRTSLLATVEAIRGIPTALDLRQNEVTMRVRTWSGSGVGFGTKTDTDTTIKVNFGKDNPRVRMVSSKDVIASGGALSSQDIKVGPFTPAFTSGGVSESAIDPATSSSPREVFFKITGQGFGSGLWYMRINDDTVPNFSRYLYLRATGAELSE